MPKTSQNGSGEAQAAPEGDSPKKPRKTAKTNSGVDIDSVHVKRKVGRPSKYSEEIADEICAGLALGHPLPKIVDANHMPSAVTVYAWLRLYPEFLKRYETARQDGAHTYAYQIAEIIDEPPAYVMDDKGNERIDPASIAQKRLRMDGRKWLAAKYLPKAYGERLQHEGVEDGAPIKVDHGIFDALIQNFELNRQSEE